MFEPADETAAEDAAAISETVGDAIARLEDRDAEAAAAKLDEAADIARDGGKEATIEALEDAAHFAADEQIDRALEEARAVFYATSLADMALNGL